MLHDSNRDHFEEQDDTNRDHFKSQGCGVSLRRNANIDHKRQTIQKQNIDDVIEIKSK